MIRKFITSQYLFIPHGLSIANADMQANYFNLLPCELVEKPPRNTRDIPASDIVPSRYPNTKPGSLALVHWTITTIASFLTKMKDQVEDFAACSAEMGSRFKLVHFR